MAVDKLTDKAFFELYKTNPKVKRLVEGIQRKHGVHWDQRTEPGYDEKEVEKKLPIANKEAKEAVEKLLGISKQAKETPAYAGGLSERTSYVAGLAGIVGGALAFSAGVASLGALGFLAAGAAAAYLYSRTPQESYKPA